MDNAASDGVQFALGHVAATKVVFHCNLLFREGTSSLRWSAMYTGTVRGAVILITWHMAFAPLVGKS
jgi:hypothetical protein